MAKQAQKKSKSAQEIEITVPPLGETVETALLARWLLKEGEVVEAGDAILELETDKISLEVPAPQRGILRSPLSEGAEVKSGQSLGKLEISEAALKKAMPARKEAPVKLASKTAVSPSAPEPQEDKFPATTVKMSEGNGEERRLKLS
ncbi:dihydrolipoamide succinyltransferase, partial [Lasius niger]